MTGSPFRDTGFAILVFSHGDDPDLLVLIKPMAFLTVVVLSRAMLPVQGEIQQVDKRKSCLNCYNCKGEGHMARQCTLANLTRNAACLRRKAMLAEAKK
ncbi:retrovirus-related pol polyprotein from transposon TNT 1-94 [Tanacetum coccineum]